MDDKTWIEQSPLGYQEQEPPPPPPPVMPPPPPPPKRQFPRWIIILLVVVFVVMLCAALGFLGYRLYQSGAFGLGSPPSGQELDPAALTQTAFVESIEAGLTEAQVESATLPPTETPAPTETETSTSAPPTETSIPTDTLVPTPAFATYTVSQGVFCRTGPSTIYPDVRAMEANQSSRIFARSLSPVDGVSVWYQVEVEGLRCFVSSGFGTVQGNLEEVPLIPAPPTPTPTPTSTPSNTPSPSPSPTP